MKIQKDNHRGKHNPYNVPRKRTPTGLVVDYHAAKKFNPYSNANRSNGHADLRSKASKSPRISGRELKLYVWTEFCPSISSGMAIAVSHSKEHAMKIIVEELGFTPWQWGDLEIYPVNYFMCSAVTGGDAI